MLRFGLVRLVAAVLVFGILVPYGLLRVSRLINLPTMILCAAALGVAYGAIKADHPWSGRGLSDNLWLMGVSAAVLALYVTASVIGARIIARAL